MDPVLRIDIDGDEVIVTGRRERLKKSVDLSLLNYVEIDGYIQTQLHDPVPMAGRISVNEAWRSLRRNAAPDL